jgi:hypothetical protein
MKLYHYFRHKKFGDPLPKEEPTPKIDFDSSKSDLQQ